jgi:NNP family nitrate/nitrite transporter-like MFS transporter
VTRNDLAEDAAGAAGSPGAARPVRGSRSRALWLATLGFFGGFAGVSIFGPLVPRFAELLDLTAFEAGILAASPSLTGSLLRIPFGAAVDRLGGRRPFLLVLMLTNVGVIGLLVLLSTSYPDRMAGTYPLLLVLGALIGCGIASFSIGIAQVSYWYKKRDQGGALGIYAGLGNTSPGLSTLMLPIAVGSLGMLGAYSVWFAVLFLITLVYGLFIRDAPWFQLRSQGVTVDPARISDLGGGDQVPAGSAMDGLRRAAAVPATWVLVFFYFISFGGFLAFTTWLPTFWVQAYDLPLREAGLLAAAFSLLAAVVRAIGGVLSDRVSIRFALPLNFALMLAATLVLSFAASAAISLAATLAVAVGMGLQNAIVFKLLPSHVPGAIGGASGWVGGLGALGGFVLPPLMGIATGLATGADGYARSFLPYAVLILLALPVLPLLSRSRAAGMAAQSSVQADA